MKPGFFQGKKFPFTPKRRKKSLVSQCNNIIDTRHDLAAFRSNLANVSWLRSYTVGGSYNQELRCGTVSTSSTITPFRKPQEEQYPFEVDKGSEDVARQYFLGRGLPRTVTVQVQGSYKVNL